MYDRTQSPGKDILAHTKQSQLKVYENRDAYDAANSRCMWRHVEFPQSLGVSEQLY
ncbi:hypothetical protein PHMEG_00031856 [Phytophthora megakarya]|uniref:Uncharacterized protein n=1 Tax=Phytophthora megakarya TaxID=4795 RepID=A0A225UXB9_9STRA|nr:hypothetical protein PHMEG_00031856 [Phytophthora megakarya]